MEIEIIGVYEVEAEEPCHLIELSFEKTSEDIYIDLFAQQIENNPIGNWQVPYDEHFLNSEGTCVLPFRDLSEIPVGSKVRVVFFYHYLDFNLPFDTPFGEAALPKPRPKPARLSFVEYEPPD